MAYIGVFYKLLDYTGIERNILTATGIKRDFEYGQNMSLKLPPMASITNCFDASRSLGRQSATYLSEPSDLMFPMPPDCKSTSIPIDSGNRH